MLKTEVSQGAVPVVPLQTVNELDLARKIFSDYKPRSWLLGSLKNKFDNSDTSILYVSKFYKLAETFQCNSRGEARVKAEREVRIELFFTFKARLVSRSLARSISSQTGNRIDPRLPSHQSNEHRVYARQHRMSPRLALLCFLRRLSSA